MNKKLLGTKGIATRSKGRYYGLLTVLLGAFLLLVTRSY